MLKAENLIKDFGKRRVVQDVCLEVGENEVVGLLGKNGAGKSTSFRMIIGILKPTAGRIEFLGKDISKWPMYKRCRAGMGYLSQEQSIFRNLTNEQNLMAILEQLSLSRRERKQRCAELLAEYGLTKIKDQHALRNSGGEKRRLEIARALVTNPKLILLDEPFAGVDPIATGDIREMVRALKDRGISVLVTDHDVANTLRSTDRTYIMDEGKVFFSGTPREALEDSMCRTTYIGDDFQLDLDQKQSQAPAEPETAPAKEEASS